MNGHLKLLKIAKPHVGGEMVQGVSRCFLFCLLFFLGHALFFVFLVPNKSNVLGSHPRHTFVGVNRSERQYVPLERWYVLYRRKKSLHAARIEPRTSGINHTRLYHLTSGGHSINMKSCLIELSTEHQNITQKLHKNVLRFSKHSENVFCSDHSR